MTTTTPPLTTPAPALVAERPPGDRRARFDAMRAVVAKDLTAVRRSKAVVLPMLFVPVLLLIVLPLLIGLVASGGRLEVLDLDAELLAGLLEAGEGGVVERLVAATADVVHHADPDVGVTAGALL